MSSINKTQNRTLVLKIYKHYAVFFGARHFILLKYIKNYVNKWLIGTLRKISFYVKIMFTKN